MFQSFVCIAFCSDACSALGFLWFQTGQVPETIEPRLPSLGAGEHFCQPLLDAVAAHIKSPMLNHTLKRTFGPAVHALHGPPLRSAAAPLLICCCRFSVQWLRWNWIRFATARWDPRCKTVAVCFRSNVQKYVIRLPSYTCWTTCGKSLLVGANETILHALVLGGWNDPDLVSCLNPVIRRHSMACYFACRLLRDDIQTPEM